MNVTEDSFSVGGRHLDPEHAIAHALALVREGADAIDVGAAASNPDARPVPVDEQIRRLEPVVAALGEAGVPVSVDAFDPEVQRWALAHDVAYLNDVRGFAAPSLHAVLANGNSRLVVMHDIHHDGRQSGGIGDATDLLFDRVATFLEERVAMLEQAGVARERCLVDPGMGLFLGRAPDASLGMLRRLGDLRRRLGLPVLVSVSRKSFLGALTGRAPDGRGAATLAAELFAARQGVDWIRTHDVGALRDALLVDRALGGRG